MSTFPKIKGITWLSEGFPDLISIKIIMVDRKIQDLDIKGMAVPEIEVDQYIDLSKLAGVREWYPPESEEPSLTECVVDVDGVDNFIGNLPIKNLLQAWIFYKHFKYANDTRNS